ncbi:flagellar hook-associated protein FlgK [Pseudomonas abieticivorans]|uniref:flagellar hook-associated protein FlgK n=1 Tax=Pseudomonas abieticivorans TaxID=2931382 RepID=UPI0020766D63|nr:flagellar hook-associated protein FlgK [Pseudomonas sp. PIA16]
MSLISIGLSGLNASQTALTVTSNNITNVSTAGYSRQSALSASSAVQNIGVGFVGTGTTISDVRRIYNSYMDSQLQTTTALSSDAAAYSSQVNTLDSLLSDSATGISSTLTSFFAALQTASSNPTDTSSRQLLLTSAQTLSNRFNSISTQISSQNTGINSQLSTLTGQVNDLTKQIASLNQQITTLSASGNTPNSLMDTRNEAVRSLNELVGVTVQQNGSGAYDVYLGTGQALVSGNTSNTLTAAPGTTDKSQYNLTVNYGNYSSDVTSVVSGGTIGGLLRYRSDVLDPAQNSLGQIALTVSDSINSQLAQGVDNNGNLGSNLFSSINSATAIAQRSLASSSNSTGSGNLDVTIADTGALTNNDYQVTFTSPTAYSVTRSDGTAMGSYDLGDDPAPVIDGFTLSLNGNDLSTGDTFKVIPTRNAASAISTTMTDTSTLAFSGPLTGTASASNSGTASFTQPSLTSSVDIYDSTSKATLQSGLENSTPVKLVFDAAASGTQAYTVYDAKGNNIGSGSIVPGQDNNLSINVPMLDSSGNAVTDGSGNALSFSFATTVSGSPATNDSYSVAFNTTGKSDNRNATALLGLQTSATVGTSAATGGVSFTSAYASLVSGVGAQASQATTDASATSAVLATAKSNRDSVSGVNLDDEAAALVKFQQYYTASSQIIKTAQDTFTTLLNAL